jgi:glycosyltransferase involved in cell wall biosynthesis
MLTFDRISNSSPEQLKRAIAERRLRLVVVVPCYNVENQVREMTATIPAYVDGVVLIDDCSTDGTAQILDGLRSERVRVIHLSQNQGVGGAVLVGYLEAVAMGGDILIKMDGDGQMDPAYLPALVQPILNGEADYTKGNRFLHGKQIGRMPFFRRLGNIGLSFLVKFSSGYWPVFDPTNGYTAIAASILPLLEQEGIARRYFFEINMLIELGRQRAVVRDVSIPARYGAETSSLSEVHTLVDFPPRLLRAFFHRILDQYFIRDFSAVSLFLTVGLSMLLFGSVWSAYHWIRSIQLGLAATTGTVMIGVLPIILGIQMLLQAVVMDIQSVPDRPIH